MELLYILLVLLLATRLGGECAERFGLPTLVGELLAGIVLGVVAARFSASFPVLSELNENEVFHGIADLGIFFLMLLAGLELKPADIVESSKVALAVALGGMVLPLALGFGIAWWFLPASDVKFAQALFLGTAMAITAVPVTVKILMDLGKLQSRVGKILVSAAVYDDIASLVLLAVLTGVIAHGALPDLLSFGWLLAKVVGFFAIAIALGHYAFPWIGKRLKNSAADEFNFSMLLVAAMAYAVIGELLGLHFIVGAFLAGLFFRRTTVDEEAFEGTKARISGITIGFLAPIFFASIGFSLDVAAVTKIPMLLFLILVAAFLGKLIGGGVPAYMSGSSARESTAIGAGMCARGAVELIIAGIALRAGLFSQPDPTPDVVTYLFSAVVIMAVVTTIAAPLIMAPLLRGGKKKE
jgi:Kef-type K+ transport system membrane component KefB